MMWKCRAVNAVSLLDEHLSTPEGFGIKYRIFKSIKPIYYFYFEAFVHSWCFKYLRLENLMF